MMDKQTDLGLNQNCFDFDSPVTRSLKFAKYEFLTAM